MSEQERAYSDLVYKLRVDANFVLTVPQKGKDAGKYFVVCALGTFGPYNGPTQAIVGAIRAIATNYKYMEESLERADETIANFYEGHQW